MCYRWCVSRASSNVTEYLVFCMYVQSSASIKSWAHTCVSVSGIDVVSVCVCVCVCVFVCKDWELSAYVFVVSRLQAWRAERVCVWERCVLYIHREPSAYVFVVSRLQLWRAERVCVCLRLQDWERIRVCPCAGTKVVSVCVSVCSSARIESLCLWSHVCSHGELSVYVWEVCVLCIHWEPSTYVWSRICRYWRQNGDIHVSSTRLCIFSVTARTWHSIPPRKTSDCCLLSKMCLFCYQTADVGSHVTGLQMS
jgi:hypothetical protein